MLRNALLLYSALWTADREKPDDSCSPMFLADSFFAEVKSLANSGYFASSYPSLSRCHHLEGTTNIVSGHLFLLIMID
jgi:hypothetical protein